MSKKESDRPLGVKQLFGPAKSNLPTLHRREVERRATGARQSAARQQRLIANRDLGNSVNDEQRNQPTPVPIVEEAKQVRLRCLEEFRARKAQERQEQLRNRKKPFVVGVAQTRTPVATPAKGLKTPGHSTRPTPNRLVFASGQRSQAVGQSKPLMRQGGLSMIPRPGVRRGIPIVAGGLAKNANVQKAVTPVVPLAATPIVQLAATATEPTPNETSQDIGASINSTFEILPVQADDGKSGRDGSVSESEGSATEEAHNGTFTLDDGEQHVVDETNNHVTDVNHEPLATLDCNIPWRPDASSSPKKEGQDVQSMHGARSGFGMPYLSNNTPTFEAKNVMEIGCGTVNGGSDYKTSENMAENANDGAPSKHEVSAAGDGNPAANEIVEVEQTSTNVRRSSRTTRFTGSFKSQSTPGRSSKDTKPKPVSIDALLDDIILSEPGILDVSTPDFLLPMDASPRESSNIMNSLASLDLSSNMSSIRSQRPSVDTWTSLEPTIDFEDGESLLFSTFPNSSAGTSILDKTWTASAPSSPVPEVTFNAPPKTPASILRTDVGASTQKKSVRFRQKIGSPIFFDARQPPNTGTPATQIVKSFMRRQSSMPKAGDSNMMSFSDDDDTQ